MSLTILQTAVGHGMINSVFVLFAFFTHLNLSYNGSHQRRPKPLPSWSQSLGTACSSGSRRRAFHHVRTTPRLCLYSPAAWQSIYLIWCSLFQKQLWLTSVVMTRQEAVGLMVTSPVISPTSWNSSYISLYFWLERALMGLVKITLCFSLRARAMAYLQEEERVNPIRSQIWHYHS